MNDSILPLFHKTTVFINPFVYKTIHSGFFCIAPPKVIALSTPIVMYKTKNEAKKFKLKTFVKIKLEEQ